MARTDTGLASALADWAGSVEPTADELAMADRALTDTVAVALAARDEPLLGRLAGLGDAGRWAVAAHLLDFDDLHIPSTAHIGAVVVPAVLAAGGGAAAFLAGAGVMARLGAAWGWRHYQAGWHVTCTAGAPGAAAAAAVSMGLDIDAIARAVALAVPSAGGVQRAFGSDAKSVQVGMASEAGVRAARLAAAGVDASLDAVDAWFALLGGDPAEVRVEGPAVPGGLAIKLHPCCYAMQRPIAAVREAGAGGIGAARVERIVVRTLESGLQPLIHRDPRTGLQAKFSIEYALAAAVVDDVPTIASFTDDAVARPEVRALLDRIEVQVEPGGDSLLSGTTDVEVHTVDGEVLRASVASPPGAPDRPPTPEQLALKVADCTRGAGLDDLDWRNAADRLRGALPVEPSPGVP